jgi:hypothetical protein
LPTNRLAPTTNSHLNESQGSQNANSHQQDKAMSAKTIGIIQVKGGAG